MALFIAAMRFSGAAISPFVMLSLAGGLFLQSSFALTARIFSIKKGGVQRTIIFEAIAYAGIIYMLISGLLNYGFGISGRVELSPGAEWSRIEELKLKRGFLSEGRISGLKIRAESLENAAGERPSEVSVEFEGKDGGKYFFKEISPGGLFEAGPLMIKYIGDAYMAFVSVYKEDLDLLPGPLVLYEEGGGIYVGGMAFGHPEIDGEGKYDPSAGLFSIRLIGNDAVDFNFRYGEGASEGDYRVRVNALAHYGRFDVWSPGLRGHVIFGIVLFLAGLSARLYIAFFPLHKDGRRLF